MNPASGPFPRWLVRAWPPLWRAAASVLTALFLTLAFPPFRQSEAAWGALVPLLLIARFTEPLRAMAWGAAGGFLFWLATLHWLLRLAVTGAPWPLATLGWLALAACCAMYQGAFAGVVSAMMEDLRSSDRGHPDAAPPEPARWPAGLVRVLGTPLVWVGFEYARSVLWTGFPWNQLGVSQFRNVSVIQLAEWGGVYAVSGLVALLNAVAFSVVLRALDVLRRRRVARLPIETVAGLAVFGFFLHQAHRLGAREMTRESDAIEVRVAAIQPNVEQRKKWEPGAEREVYARLEAQTEWALAFRGDLDLILWPETALPTALNEDAEAWAFVRGLAREGVPILVGALETETPPTGRPGAPRLYNASFLVDRNGEIVDVYRKQHLVPFGEYVPFERRIPWLQRFAPLGFSCTPGATGTVFRLPRRHAIRTPGETTGTSDLPTVAFSVLICFEDTVPRLARAAVRHGARFLVVQTNDAWFDPWAGSLQHLTHCVFRCVENRVPAVRAANTGVTAFVDRLGRIENAAFLEAGDWDRGVEGYKISRVLVESSGRPPSLYTQWGDWPFALPCAVGSLISLGCVGYLEWRRRRPAERGDAES